MTILREEPLRDDLSIGEVAKYDSKANMLETFRLIGVGVAKSWDKTGLATGMDMVFSQSPALFANILPKEERGLLAGLLESKQDECVSCPADEKKFLMLQRLHLVVTYEDKKHGTWRLYMPDQIRQRLNGMLKEDLKQYPELEEMHNLLGQITEKRDRLYHLLDTTNPDTLTKEKAKALSVEVEAIAKFFEEAKPRLKKVEQYLEANTDTKIDAIWDDFKTTEMFIAVARAGITAVLQGQPLPVKKAQTDKVVPMKRAEGMRELTLKVQLGDTPIYRKMKVIDRCSLFELNMLIQFLYNWNEMNPYSFVFHRDGQKISPLKTTRLSAFGLQEDDTFQFKYDTFGDKWVHTLTVEKVEPYTGKEADYEPECIAGNGPDPGKGAGGNAWVHRNLPYMLKNKRKYSPFSKAEINNTIHFWWSMERPIWIGNGTIRYDD